MTTEKYQPAKCESCQHLRIISGDWVPYGSTRAQLPDDWECEAKWTDEENKKAEKTGEDSVEQLFLGNLQECSHFLELPHCSIHPEQLVDGRYGCSKCEDEYFKQYEESDSLGRKEE